MKIKIPEEMRNRVLVRHGEVRIEGVIEALIEDVEALRAKTAALGALKEVIAQRQSAIAYGSGYDTENEVLNVLSRLLEEIEAAR